MHIGIDPGKSGAIAAISDDFVAVLPRLGKWSDTDILAWVVDIVAGSKVPPRCVLEHVHSSPQMGVVSAFTFGREFGRLQAIMASQAIPVALVRPQRWQKEMGCMTKGDKRVTRELAQRMFPAQKVTHYTADALLLAEYCRRFDWESYDAA
jgi:crossover junction endodeoxyribonuclease RuvC